MLRLVSQVEMVKQCIFLESTLDDSVECQCFSKCQNIQEGLQYRTKILQEFLGNSLAGTNSCDF